MRKLKWIAALLLASAMVLVGCNNGNSDNQGGGASGEGDSGNDEPLPDKIDVKVYLLNKPEDATAEWGMWWWYDYKTEKGTDIEVSGKKGSWPTGADTLTEKDDVGAYVIINYETKHPRLGLLFVDKNGKGGQSQDIVVPLEKFSKTKTLFCLFDNMTGYYTDITETYGLVGAQITKGDGLELNAKVYKTEATKDNITVKDKDGNSLAVTAVEQIDVVGDTKIYKITVSDGSHKKAPYTVMLGRTKSSASFNLDLIDDVYGYTGDDLGLTLNSNGTATFKTWAPMASEVKLLLYASSSSFATPAQTVPMTLDGTTGVWVAENVSYGTNKYYQYQIKNTSESKVADIWHTVASGDSVASQIASIDDSSAVPAGWETSYTNPWANSTEKKNYSDAVIYEMHIRDWGKAVGGDGKFLDFVNKADIINHLKDLGVTHVQILPMFDYAEKNADNNYNWGYNPYHYNVPEGRYVTSGYSDGTQAVKEMREMILALHKAGIAVNMDVVYNHTNGTGTGSLYDMTIPGYFYRQDDNGNLTNGSGCGNEVATQRKMVKKYVIDSLKHWMTDYHINGFRFDLMGCQEKTTMQEIYEELYKIDPNVMVYGEPWTGGGSSVQDGSTGAVAASGNASGSSINGIGCFDDDFRDTLVKAGMSAATDKGHIQGTFADENLLLGLTGALISNNSRNETGKPGLALHYVECHDNLTLFDKLAMSNFNLTATTLANGLTEEQTNVVRKQQKLAAAYIFLSQGTPFINGGQEFMRTKKGDHNSYQSTDAINQIDLSFKTTYSDVYNVYKGLIALRKANKGAFGSNTSAKAETLSAGVTKYNTGDYLIYFNATEAEKTITTTGYSKAVDVTSGTPTEGTTLPTKVEAKGFVILKK